MRVLGRVGLLCFFCALPSWSDRAELEPLPEKQWNAAHAAHLLARAGFGGTPEEIRRLAGMPLAQAVAWVVDYEGRPAGSDLTLSPREGDPEHDQRIKRELDVRLRRLREQNRHREMTPELQRQLERAAEQQAVGAVLYRLRLSYAQQLRGWWLRRMVRGVRPLEEKMTLFWHGHFATGLSTVYSVTLMKHQNDLFRRHATGNFGQLLLGVARDPAMLRYLDGARNNKRNPNENFSRELLELFTLGRGNYTEQDVRSAARAFTGWTSAGTRFYFNRRQHDYRRKTFLGRTGRFDGTDVIQMLLGHPATARRLVTKLCRFFIGQQPSGPLVEGLAQLLRRGKYELKPLLRTLLASRAFYSSEAVGRKIKSPTELVVGAVRQLGLPLESLGLVQQQMVRMGQNLLEPPNVKGWDGGRAWINSATLLVRYNLMYDVVISGQRNARQRRTRNPLAPGFGWTANELLELPILKACVSCKSSREVIDLLAQRLLGGRLTKARRAQLQAMLWDPQQLFDVRRPKTRMKILFVLVLLSATPEYQLH